MQQGKVYGAWTVDNGVKTTMVLWVAMLVFMGVIYELNWGFVVAIIITCAFFWLVIAHKKKTKVFIQADYVTYRTVFKTRDVSYSEINEIRELKERSTSDGPAGKRIDLIQYFELLDVAGKRLVRIPYTLIGDEASKQEFVADLQGKNAEILLGEEIANILEGVPVVERSTGEILTGMKDSILETKKNKMMMFVVGSVAGISVLIMIGMIVWSIVG